MCAKPFVSGEVDRWSTRCTYGYRSICRACPAGQTWQSDALRLAALDGLILYLDDGGLEIDLNAVERAIRPVTITRKNSLFAGSDVGASYCPSGDVLIKSANFAEDRQISGAVTASPRRHGARRPAQVNKPNYPGRAGAKLPPGKHAVGHHSVGCRTAHLQSFGRFVERDLASLGAFASAINQNTMGVSKTANMSARPAGTMRRRLSGAVQDRPAITLSGNCRARTRTRSTTPASVVHRVWPTLFFLTFISV